MRRIDIKGTIGCLHELARPVACNSHAFGSLVGDSSQFLMNPDAHLS
jgi:hypothetical protein